MTFLSAKSIHELARAACEIAIDEQALVETLPPQVASKMELRSSPAGRILGILTKLNYWQARDGEEPPLCTLLRNAAYFAEGRVQAAMFEDALAEIEQRGPRTAKPSPRPFHDLWMKRAKRFYTSHGYEVVPPETEHSTTFFAYRGVEFVEVVAVADDNIEEAIAAVTRQLVEEVQPNEPFATGYVVLTSKTKEQQRSDETKVRSANLRPLYYTDLPPIGPPEFEIFVDRQHAWILAEPEPEGLRDADLGDARLDDLLRGLLSDRDARILYLSAGNRRAAWHARRRIAHVCSEDFVNKPDAPVPLVLSLSQRPWVADLKDLVAEAFRSHEVRFSPLALPKLLEGGALLPIFAAVDDAPSGPFWPLVKQAAIGKAKAVLLRCEDDAAPIPSLARHLNVPTTGMLVGRLG